MLQKKPQLVAEAQPASHHVPDQTTLSPEAMDMAEAFSELNIDDIDTNDFDNPQLCAEYVKDIYKYIREQEVDYKRHNGVEILLFVFLDDISGGCKLH